MPNKGPSTMPPTSRRMGGQYILPDTSANDESNRNGPKAFRRSRSGCFHCRLRRKKCDEERPKCQSCSKYGLRCDYKTPAWWETTELRNRQRDRVKERIRQTKVMEKEGSMRDYMERIKTMFRKPSPKSTVESSHPLVTEQLSSKPINDPNPYVGALPTPITATATSPVTTFNLDYNSSTNTAWATVPAPSQYPAVTAPAPAFSPVNPLQPQVPTPDLTSDEWFNSAATPTTASTLVFPSQTQQMLQQPYGEPNPYSSNYGIQHPSPAPLSSCIESMIPINEIDRPLLNHFVDHVVPLVFPMSEAFQSGPVRLREILGSVKSNRSYMHCCLSVSAIHLKTSMGMADEMDHDIVKHRWEAIRQLSKALNHTSSNPIEVMDAALAMIFYNCSVGTSDDYLPDIPWHAHFRAVSNVVRKLQYAPSPLNVSLIAWIDILGSTMLGETPQFAHTYRTKHLRGISSGLQSLMGCEDRIMYLISEIACLDSLKNEKQLDDVSICNHINLLTAQLDWTEPLDKTYEAPFTPTGVVRPDMLIKIITTLFRLGARIYLYSLLPAFNPYDPSFVSLVTAVTDILQYIPAGAHGFDRALVWPLFMAGAHSVPSSLFRKTMSERVTALKYLGDLGSFGRMYRALKEIWRVADSTPSSPSSAASLSFEQAQSSSMPEPLLHWREVMKQNKWNYLLM